MGRAGVSSRAMALGQARPAGNCSQDGRKELDHARSWIFETLREISRTISPRQRSHSLSESHVDAMRGRRALRPVETPSSTAWASRNRNSIDLAERSKRVSQATDEWRSVESPGTDWLFSSFRACRRRQREHSEPSAAAQRRGKKGRRSLWCGPSSGYAGRVRPSRSGTDHLCWV
jgi:hypothetical protein